MSRTYGQIQIRFWSSPDIRGLSDQGKLLATYILTGPHSNALGCVRLLPDYVAGDLEWSRQTVAKRLGELSQVGFIKRCEGSGWTLIPSYLKYNPIRNQNVGKHIIKLIKNIPSNFIHINDLRIVLERYGNHLPNGYESVLKQYRNREPNPTQQEPNPTQPSKSETVVEETSTVEMEILEFWKETHEIPRAQLTPGRSREIMARLKEGYGVEQLRMAIIGCRASKHHMGDNDRKTIYNELSKHILHKDKIDAHIVRGERVVEGWDKKEEATE